MKTLNQSYNILLLIIALFISNPIIEAQTKKIKRPKSRVGISSVDTFVGESFNLYDKVYIYDGYAQAGTPLEDEDIDVLEEALTEMSALSESAPDIISDLDGAGILKQSKATLQINKAKKVLKYSIKTSKELLLGQRNKKEEDVGDSTDNPSSDSSSSDTSNNPESSEGASTVDNGSSNSSNALEISSKFDFVPGDKLLFFDDFSNDFIGDFPSRWNTNGSGELVTINNSTNKWLNLVPGYQSAYIPDITDLPEEFTLEFDITTNGIDKKTSSQSYLGITISENNTFTKAKNYGMTELPLCQFIARQIVVENNINGKRIIRNDIEVDIRKQMLKLVHISIAVNKQRFRLWVNQNKYLDVPRLMAKDVKMNGIKLKLRGTDINKEAIYVSNFKISEGGVDLRRKLLAEGKISTNGILFNSGSDQILPQSYGIIRQISQVLQQDPTIKLNIIGHTDADGADAINLKLSRARAKAVKNALITVYKISGDRLQTDGKGETVPVGDNTTIDGKAQNRRVEFVKI